MANIKTKKKTSRWKKYSGHDALWIQSRKVIYLYWYKFLQEAEKSDEYEVDWSRYEAWGGRDTVMSDDFDRFWDENWRELFAVNSKSGLARFPISSKSPKADGIRYALLAWQNRYLSTWDFAIWLKDHESRDTDSLGRRKRPRGIFTRIAEASADLDTSNRLTRDGNNSFESNSEAYLNQDTKRAIQKMIREYKKNALRYLNSVCEGKFP
ncbi:hypothetical protein N9L29_02365 [Litoricolaceae bacterium]|nr:hypothetical protein [Litorivicinaceae bacterium]